MNGVPEQDNGEPVGEGSSPGGIETLINAPVANAATVTTTEATLSIHKKYTFDVRPALS